MNLTPSRKPGILARSRKPVPRHSSIRVFQDRPISEEQKHNAVVFHSVPFLIMTTHWARFESYHGCSLPVSGLRLPPLEHGSRNISTQGSQCTFSNQKNHSTNFYHHTRKGEE